MCPVGNTFTLRRRSQGTHSTRKLEEKPETDEKYCGAKPVIRKEKEVESQNTGNSATGPDNWNLGCGVCSYLQPGPSHPGGQIEEEVAKVPEPDFHIVPEYPQEQHIACKM